MNRTFRIMAHDIALSINATEIAAPARDPSKAADIQQQFTSVVTRANFKAPPEEVWEALMFYEQIEERSPLHLRLLLPVPIRTEGRKSEVGDEVRCIYEDGHLLKRITQVTRSRNLVFEVIEQNLALGGGIKLSGGSYTLRELPGGHTEVALNTEYSSSRRPRWLWMSVEAFVCRMFHRHMLSAMRRKMEAALSRRTGKK
jgi:hypothetical protein